MMTTPQVIDLGFLDTKEAIASFLLETDDGLILIETGPESTFSRLESWILSHGYALKDIRLALLTHIHFDHAGAAWRLAKSGTTVCVHPSGAGHLAAPEKLWHSAERIYGKDMERLWGKMSPIPKGQIKPIGDKEIIGLGEIRITAHHTPGHAIHHIAWQLGDVVFTGDVAGVKIDNGPVVPPCPPPDIHIVHWKQSIDRLRSLNPSELYLTHFGKVDQVTPHLAQLSEILDDWAEWIKPHFEAGTDQKEVVPQFMDYTKRQLLQAGCSEELVQTYEYANPSWMSVSGLYRYWQLKREGRI